VNTDVYAFKVGDFECFAISDGTFVYEPPLIPPPAGFLFANAPKKVLRDTLNQHGTELERWLTFVDPFMCMVVGTGRHKVLVDTGAGRSTPKTGKLLQNLQSVGIEAGDIDTVILTHGHEDHIGGNSDAEGRPAFPKARYIMWKTEWTFWNSEHPEESYGDAELLAFIRKNLLSVQDRMDVIEHETEIVPGICMVPAPGHTPGHTAVSISSKGQGLLCVADAFLHPIHIEHPEWHATFDMAPQQLIETRHLLLNRAATEKALVLATHFPFPGLGHIVRKGTGWQWEPVEEGA